jgi:hypothetical protein
MQVSMLALNDEGMLLMGLVSRACGITAKDRSSKGATLAEFRVVVYCLDEDRKVWFCDGYSSGVQ